LRKGTDVLDNCKGETTFMSKRSINRVKCDVMSQNMPCTFFINPALTGNAGKTVLRNGFILEPAN